MRFGSLFSGIGGMDLGLERAGMTVAWQVEIDPWCRRVLAKHWPDVPKYGDIRELSGRGLAPIDLLARGFPCQPVSEVGSRRGHDDPRWLWPEFARLIRELRPRFVLLENVANLLNFGEFGEILSDLSTSGFDAEWSLVSACSLGASHSRERLFLVAYADRRRQEAGGAGRDGDGYALAGWAPNTQHLHSAPVFGSRTGRPSWATEPAVGRVADGVPHRVDRLGGLGNAVVPQVVEWIGRRIMALEPPK